MTLELAMPEKNRWEAVKSQGLELIRSGFLPAAIKTPEQFMAIILKGQELGIPPMQACAHIHIISGKPTMSAELMLSQILRLFPATKISYPVRTSEECQIKVQRPGNDPSLFSFSIKDAIAAGIMANPVWKKYPRAMLHARCISEMARSLFPDAISGVSYTPEELGAQVNEQGEVIDVVPTETKTVDSQTVVDVQTVAKEEHAVDRKAAPKIEIFSSTNKKHVDYISKFLVKQNAIKSFDSLMIAMSGKEFRQSVIDAEWAKINPEAPDLPPGEL